MPCAIQYILIHFIQSNVYLIVPSPSLPYPSFLSPLGCSHGLLALAFWGSVLLEIPAEGNGNPLQCSCLGNPMHRGAWQATVHGVTEELDTVTERSVFVEILKTAMSFIEWSSICG